MIRYALRRLAASILVLAVVSVALFGILRVLPGDPTLTLLGGVQGVDAEGMQKVRHQLGLDLPLWVQYLSWVKGMFSWDFGRSYFSQVPVSSLVAARAWPTIELTLVALMLAVVIAVPLALMAAFKPKSIVDSLVRGFATLVMSVPPFVVAIALIVVFAIQLRVLPTRGYVPIIEDPIGNFKVILLPALTLGLASAAPVLRFLRTSLDDVSTAPYIRTARGKGLTKRRVLLEHALPNALLPTLTVLGLIVGRLLGGVVVIEYIFSWPGLGSLIVDAVFKRDYAVLQTTVLLAAAGFILSAFVVDILYGLIDPRLRIGRSAS